MPGSSESELLASLGAEEEARTHWFVRSAFLWVPLGVTAALAGIIVLWKGWDGLFNIIGIGLFALFAGGKFTILLHEPPAGGFLPEGWAIRLFSPYHRAALITYMDIMTGVVLTYNVRLFYHLPRVGPWMEDFHAMAGEMLRQHPWIRRLTFIGVVLFVTFPLTGTGAIGGTIFGRLMGLRHWAVLTAIACGAVLGCFGMAAFSRTFEVIFSDAVRDSWQFAAGNVAVIALFIVAAAWLYRRMVLRYGAHRPTS